MTVLKKMLYQDNDDGTTTLTLICDDGSMRSVVIPMPLQMAMGAAMPMIDLDHPAAQGLRESAATIPETPDG